MHIMTGSGPWMESATVWPIAAAPIEFFEDNREDFWPDSFLIYVAM